MKRALLTLGLVCLANCTDSNDGVVGEPTESHVVRLDFPLWKTPGLDLLVVVDHSPAMAPHRANVAANLPRMIEALQQYGGMPSVHLGVVSADLGATGATDRDPAAPIGSGPGACTSTGDAAAFPADDAIGGEFIIDLRLTDGNRLANYAGELSAVFTRLGDRPATGCTYSQPLEAMRRVLTIHPTFRRTDAYLLVVFVSATDDCSFARADFTGGTLDRSRCTSRADQLVPIDEYVAFLETQQSSPHGVAITAALPHKNCTGEPTASRMSAFAERFAFRSLTRPICGELETLLTFASIKTSLAGPPCLPPTLADLDADAPGLQAACAIELAFEDGRDSAILPACANGNAPCWKVEHDLQHCPFFDGGGYAFHVQRALLDELPLGTTVRGDCLVDY